MNFYRELIQRIEQKHMDAHDYNARGNCYIRLNNYRAALADLTKATQMEPTNLYYWTDRASLFMRLRQYERAITDCTLAIAFQKFEYIKQKQYTRSRFYPFSVAVAIIAQARTLLGYNLLPPPRQGVVEQRASITYVDVDTLLLSVFGQPEQRMMVLV